MSNNVVKFTLLGSVHSMNTTQKAENVQAIADIVDEKIRNIAKRRNMEASQAFGMVAALEIAEDLFNLRKDYERLMSLADNENE